MEDSSITREALKNLNTIKDAIDRTTGAQSMMNFLWKTGWMFCVFGCAIFLGGLINIYMTRVDPAISGDSLSELWLGYFCILVLIGFIYAWFQLSNLDHTRMIRAYMQLYFSLDSLMLIIFAFLLYKHMIVFVIPFWVIIIGITLVVLAATTFVKPLMVIGYELLVLGTVGLFIIERHFLAFTCITLGVYPVIAGIYLTLRYKKRGQKVVDRQ